MRFVGEIFNELTSLPSETEFRARLCARSFNYFEEAKELIVKGVTVRSFAIVTSVFAKL
jgi:hypothetical protein